MLTCPRCGYNFNLELTAQEQAALKTVSEQQRFRRGPVPTSLVADLLGFGNRHTRRWLSDLERLGYVQRRGKKGGWMIAHHEHVALALVA